MNIEKILRKALKVINANQKPSGKCLSYEDIAAMLDNGVSKKQRKRIIAHICTCKKCADDLSSNYELHERR